jgi:hypothetical protein
MTEPLVPGLSRLEVETAIAKLKKYKSSIWRMQKILSVVDLLRRNPHWWSPIISSL